MRLCHGAAIFRGKTESMGSSRQSFSQSSRVSTLRNGLRKRTPLCRLGSLPAGPCNGKEGTHSLGLPLEVSGRKGLLVRTISRSCVGGSLPLSPFQDRAASIGGLPREIR